MLLKAFFHEHVTQLLRDSNIIGRISSLMENFSIMKLIATVLFLHIGHLLGSDCCTEECMLDWG
jgi:hypothetical protein